MAALAWYASQIEFLRAHSYFTPAAQTLPGPGEAHNLQPFGARLSAAAC